MIKVKIDKIEDYLIKNEYDPKMEKVFNLCRDKLEEYYTNNQ